ncbi:unnamed protein product [Alternaria sp. RS040]
MIAIAGISWGVTQWVPFAIIGEETAKFSTDEESAEREDEHVWSVVQGGTIVGLHNTAISLPQIIAALIRRMSGLRSEMQDVVPVIIYDVDVCSILNKKLRNTITAFYHSFLQSIEAWK